MTALRGDVVWLAHTHDVRSFIPPLLALIVLTTVPTAILASDPGPSNGFRGLKWDDPPSQDMIPSDSTLHGMTAYLRPQDRNTSVAGLPVELVTYYFHERRFCYVLVGWPLKPKRATFDQLADALNKVWGNPDDVKETGERFWVSRTGSTFAGLRRHEGPELGITLSLGNATCLREARERHTGL